MNQNRKQFLYKTAALKKTGAFVEILRALRDPVSDRFSFQVGIPGIGIATVDEGELERFCL